ncbi:CaiB/BaiF CoA transferase family protein [Novosphingobium sp. JCM 18896]|uniref:CaiB/BaiF CoA transferase family protein n=1 Tax=Novosphingobium sp. JCM 18896 TaxID=2989731 RepID=UPI0022216BF2|nr:CoA transferase [Novosphingobium sp. JCM 18896]MCW1432378.1 CoA transferase [Novosphingobium sp. JCM 18896]
MKDLLAGVRVIEAAVYGFVPAAGAALADCGADVIKIEHPRNGDPVRHLSTYGINPGDGGVTTLWECFNRGKKSLAMDISTARGREILLSLVDDADVFITSMMQPARARLGIDADQLMARNPRLIYGRGTGQGPLGPDADKGGFDGLSYWSRPGVSTAASPPDYDFPVLLAGPAFGDVQSGLNLAGAILGALYRREKTGSGGVVDVSLFSSGLWAMQASIAGCYATGRQNIEQLDRRCPPNPLTNIYRSGDGRFFVLGMLEADRYWAKLCSALDRADLAVDSRFGTMSTRREHSADLVRELDGTFGQWALDEVARRLDSQEGQWSRVEYPGDVFKDEQAVVNEFIQMVDYENGARLPLVAMPARIDGAGPKLTRAPAHGEHTPSVLSMAGIAGEELAELRRAGVVA